ncbi:MAG: hypothetical protein ACYDGR_11895 [Candidatus Dormibacteria bacterium]
MRIRAKGVLLATLALLTPAGLVLVNLAAYVMAHLAAFRVAITVSAVVSTIVLNGLTIDLLYRGGGSRWPSRYPFRPEDRRQVVAVAGALILIGAGLAGVLTYRGLADPRRLPNLQTFLAGLVGLVTPLAVAILFREEVNPRLRRRYRTRT